MLKLLYEIELNGGSLDEAATYLYIEADEDIELNINRSDSDVTHITTIDTDLGMEPDLIITRRVE